MVTSTQPCHTQSVTPSPQEQQLSPPALPLPQHPALLSTTTSQAALEEGNTQEGVFVGCFCPRVTALRHCSPGWGAAVHCVIGMER